MAWSRNSVSSNTPKSLQFDWQGTSLGIRVEGEENFTYTDLEGIQGPQGLPGNDGADGAIGPKGDKGDKGDQGIQGPQGLKGDKGNTGSQGLKGDKGDQGDPGPADWNALPETNPRSFIFTAKQIILGVARALRIESAGPTIELIDTNPGQANGFIHLNSSRLYFLPDRDEDEAWEGPWSYFDFGIDELIVFGNVTWHTGNFNPNEHWRKDELLKFSKRWNVASNASINFLQIDFANTAGVAAYSFEILIWGGTLNNYSNLYRYSFMALIEDQNVQFSPSTMSELISFSTSNNSITLTFDLWGSRNNLVVEGECLWGFNWVGHTVL